MLEKLKDEVLEANLKLPAYGLVTLTWGNVSAIDREKGLIVIKPSGVDYDEMRVNDMVVVNLDGQVIEGNLNPSSDTPTHIELYKHFPLIGGIVHTHSEWATSWAQGCRSIPSYGTTHADTFYGDIPCTRMLTDDEIEKDYEKNTGLVIIETFRSRNYMAVPGVLCAHHGPFVWGKDAISAVNNSLILENVAKMASHTELINSECRKSPISLQNKHYYRKHGSKAYYGQG